MKPLYRPRRLRKSEAVRRLVRQTNLSLDQMIMPFFVREMKEKKKAIPSFPGVYQYSQVGLLTAVSSWVEAGGNSLLLFGAPQKKDLTGKEAYASDGVVQKAVKAIKKKFPDLFVITDVCLCAYLKHGHCGVLKNGCIDNDSSLELLAKVALSHAKAGADMVAPSDMMDGRVAAIREILDENSYEDVSIMSYAAKYASSFYGPFRDAADSSPLSGDRKSYQMDYANKEEAMREIALDIEEGADIILIKPALAYLDIIHEAKNRFSVPIAAYNVSGEYALTHLAAKEGLASEKDMILEILTSIRRSGADIIITYHAQQYAQFTQ